MPGVRASVARAAFAAVSGRDPDGIVAPGAPGWAGDFAAVGEIRGARRGPGLRPRAVRRLPRLHDDRRPDRGRRHRGGHPVARGRHLHRRPVPGHRAGRAPGPDPRGRREGDRGRAHPAPRRLLRRAALARQRGRLPGVGSRAGRALLAAFGAKTTRAQRARDRRRRRSSRTRQPSGTPGAVRAEVTPDPGSRPGRIVMVVATCTKDRVERHVH